MKILDSRSSLRNSVLILVDFDLHSTDLGPGLLLGNQDRFLAVSSHLFRPLVFLVLKLVQSDKLLYCSIPNDRRL